MVGSDAVRISALMDALWRRDPATHHFHVRMDARVKPAHDDGENQSRLRDNRSALAITLTDDSAIAAAPIIGESRIPNAG